MKGQRGSVTLEAAVALVTLISGVLCLSIFLRVTYIHGVIQHALIQTSNELSTYSYFYSLSRLDEINDTVLDYTQAANEQTSQNIDEMNKFFEQITGKANKLMQLDFSEDEEEIKLPSINIKNAIIYFLEALADTGINKAKTATLCAVVVEPLLKTYIPQKNFKMDSVEEYLKSCCVKDGKLHYENSEFFRAENNGERDIIHLVVWYDLDFSEIAPFSKLIIPNDGVIRMANGVKVRIWQAYK